MGKIEIIISFIGILSFIGAVPQLWGSNWKKIYLYHLKGIISWETVHKSILKIAHNKEIENFQPTLIFGVGRGGIICSGLFCSELISEELIVKSKKEGKNIHSPKIKLETINSTIYLKDSNIKQIKGKSKFLTSSIDKIELSNIDFDIEGIENILVIVAQNFTGSTLEKATNMLLKKGVRRECIKTVAIFWHKHENINIVHVPDFVGNTTSINKTMPWKIKDITTDRY